MKEKKQKEPKPVKFKEIKMKEWKPPKIPKTHNKEEKKSRSTKSNKNEKMVFENIQPSVSELKNRTWNLKNQKQSKFVTITGSPYINGDPIYNNNVNRSILLSKNDDKMDIDI